MTKVSIKSFTEKCRELQGKFRESIGEEMGVGPFKTSTTKYTNMISDGENSGKNFVDEYTFNYAKMRVALKQKNETIEEFRLFNNLLSSQPMAFNLFCPLKQMLENGQEDVITKIITAVFPDMNIARVTEIGLEFLHTDVENYLNDKTAMDAIIRFVDSENRPCFIAIEIKYTDTLGTNSAREKGTQKKFIEELKFFSLETEEALINNRKEISQIYRNFLLSECYRIKEGVHESYSIILSPENHPTTKTELLSLKEELLPEYQYKINSISLEQFVETIIENCPEDKSQPFIYFKNRYLNGI